MLFRTVYGPELAAIYHFLGQTGHSLARSAIHEVFVPRSTEASTQNVDDALSFLVACGLLGQDDNGNFEVIDSEELPFRLLVLRHLQDISAGRREAHSAVDVLYCQLLDDLFAAPGDMFVADVHAEANRLRQVADIGGLSREKLQAWQRVMSFLGIGARLAGGFRCAYDPSVVLSILRSWPSGSGTMQDFLEKRCALFLPYQTKTGEMFVALEESLRYLEEKGLVELASRQDSPSKPYLGTRRIRHIGLLA
jgi:hypothetical protein